MRRLRRNVSSPPATCGFGPTRASAGGPLRRVDVPCRLAVAPLQDVLGLGADARINAPGTMGPKNWS
ncbi:MAG: 4-alpha-glucanotransferase [Intestinimonas sp.]